MWLVQWTKKSLQRGKCDDKTSDTINNQTLTKEEVKQDKLLNIWGCSFEVLN